MLDLLPNNKLCSDYSLPMMLDIRSLSVLLKGGRSLSLVLNDDPPATLCTTSFFIRLSKQRKLASIAKPKRNSHAKPMRSQTAKFSPSKYISPNPTVVILMKLNQYASLKVISSPKRLFCHD